MWLSAAHIWRLLQPEFGQREFATACNSSHLVTIFNQKLDNAELPSDMQLHTLTCSRALGGRAMPKNFSDVHPGARVGGAEHSRLDHVSCARVTSLRWMLVGSPRNSLHSAYEASRAYEGINPASRPNDFIHAGKRCGQ